MQSAPDVVGADVLTAVVFVRRDLPGNAGAPELDVDGLQASGGAVIKALPTGVMLVFPTASGALAWSAARLAGDASGLAIGVSVGDVVVAEDDRFGLTVVEAARLVQRRRARHRSGDGPGVRGRGSRRPHRRRV